MKTKYYFLIALVALPVLVFTAATRMDSINQSEQLSGEPPVTLVEIVREATEEFKDLDAAEAAGYGAFHGCVSGPEVGAMGVHFVNGNLVGDDILDATQPEALIYEVRNGQYQLTGIEFIVFADTWHANNTAPPTLEGQVFNYVGSPNRYNLPAFYELHVWAWKHNPSGTFSDWNPKVSCENYVGEDAAGSHH